jgi:misacylated tRNA(Ala) deacylase
VPATDRLYLDDSTRRTFDATVTRRLDDRVVLDRTCFYPTGGGQPHDTGQLRTEDGASWRVTDVEKRDGVAHALDGEAPPPAAGTAVVGEVDWDRRYGHMRHHTAQHLLSAVLLERYGAKTTGNQVYSDRARLDCDHPRFDDDDLEAIEGRMNELVASSLPVRWYELDRGTAEADLDPDRTRIELLPESITEVRIVEIGPAGDPFDRTACAGTHVGNTSEIGAVTVTGRETRGPDAERLRFELE